MTGLLSIVWRELAVGARQTSTHRARFIAGAIVVTFFGLFLALQSYPPNVLGPMLFSISSTLLFLQALLSGLRFTADSLSEEKREGTLGLLFLTELRSVEVVVGKMVVRSIRGFYGLIAMLPIFTFCILLGGVRGIDAFNTATLLIATMIFSLAAGIFVSSHATEDKAAFLGTIGILTALCVIPPIVRQIFFVVTKSNALDFLLYASPFYAMHALPGGGPTRFEFLRSIAGLFILATVFVTLAALNLSASFKRDFAEPPRAKKEKTPLLRQASRRRLESNPFGWLLEREHLYRKILGVFAIMVIGGSIIGVALAKRPGPGVFFAIAIYSLYFLHFIWKTMVASDALRRLHHDRRSGALEQLLVTPLPVEQILLAQLNRTFLLFAPSAIALGIANFIFFTQTYLTDMFSICIGGTVFLLIDARTLIWRAMLQALKPSRYPVAILRVTGITLLPPIFVLMLVMWSSAGRGISSYEMSVRFLVWFTACAIYDTVLIQMAKAKLKWRFRELASEPSKPPTSKRPLPKALHWLFLIEPRPAHSR